KADQHQQHKADQQHDGQGLFLGQRMGFKHSVSPQDSLFIFPGKYAIIASIWTDRRAEKCR
ncbi:MAG: hypothetical protein J6J19_06975, partial [Oscillospiraceae bacterium]|nr:hypothetical protein [Oscillospiraceae bacterium]